MMPTAFLDLTSLVYQSLNHELYNSFVFSPTYLVSCRHIKLILLLVIVSTTFIDFPVRVPIFHVSKQIIFSWTSLFTHTCLWRCGNSCLFFTASRWRWSGPCSFDTVHELYNTLLSSNDLSFTLFLIWSMPWRFDKVLHWLSELNKTSSFTWTWDRPW